MKLIMIVRGLFAIALCVAWCTLQGAEEERRYAFYITADPQYLAEKTGLPAKLDRFSDEANKAFLERLKAHGIEVDVNLFEQRILMTDNPDE